MKNIKVTTKNAGYVFDEEASAIRNAAGRAKTHTMDLQEIQDFLLETEQDILDRGMTMKQLVGTEVQYTPGFNLPGSYRGRVITSEITAKRVTDGWRLTNIENVETYPKSSANLEIKISHEARDRIVKTALENMKVPAEDTE